MTTAMTGWEVGRPQAPLACEFGCSLGHKPTPLESPACKGGSSVRAGLTVVAGGPGPPGSPQARQMPLECKLPGDHACPGMQGSRAGGGGWRRGRRDLTAAHTLTVQTGPADTTGTGARGTNVTRAWVSPLFLFRSILLT